MQGLSSEELAAIFAPRKSRTESVGGFAMIRGENGLEKVPLSKLTVGAFEGKTGTLRRSRKGRTYHAPNGQRYYAGQYDTPEVVSYQPGV